MIQTKNHLQFLNFEKIPTPSESAMYLVHEWVLCSGKNNKTAGAFCWTVASLEKKVTSSLQSSRRSGTGLAVFEYGQARHISVSSNLFWKSPRAKKQTQVFSNTPEAQVFVNLLSLVHFLRHTLKLSALHTKCPFISLSLHHPTHPVSIHLSIHSTTHQFMEYCVWILAIRRRSQKRG